MVPRDRPKMQCGPSIMHRVVDVIVGLTEARLLVMHEPSNFLLIGLNQIKKERF